MKLTRLHDPGAVVPWYLGRCWQDIDYFQDRVTLIGFNWVLAWGRSAYIFIRYGPKPSYYMRMAQKAGSEERQLNYDRGFTDGSASALRDFRR